MKFFTQTTALASSRIVDVICSGSMDGYFISASLSFSMYYGAQFFSYFIRNFEAIVPQQE